MAILAIEIFRGIVDWPFTHENLIEFRESGLCAIAVDGIRFDYKPVILCVLTQYIVAGHTFLVELIMEPRMFSKYEVKCVRLHLWICDKRRNRVQNSKSEFSICTGYEDSEASI